MKYQNLKKRLFKETGILLGALALLLAAVYYFDSLDEDYAKATNDLEGKVNSITAQATNTRGKYDEVKQNMALYEEAIERQSRDGFTIHMPLMRDTFAEFKSRYYLSNLRVSMGTLAEVADPKYKRNNMSAVASDVTVGFEAVTDEDVYNMLAAIPQELSGCPKITQFVLSLNQPLTNDVFAKIKEKGPYPLVKGEMKITWLGLKTSGTDDNANAQTKKP